jgi:dynein heavy chain
VGNFDWLSRIRCNWEEDNVHVKMMQTDFMYQCEYLWNIARLVITQLADMLRMALIGATNLHLGGASRDGDNEGPGEGGGGEVRGVQLLGVAEGECDGEAQVIIDALARPCFGEFNRIAIEVLSVIAQQIATIQNAVNDRLDVCIVFMMKLNKMKK